MNKLIELLEQMKEASTAAMESGTKELDMTTWDCGTACCLCGDAMPLDPPFFAVILKYACSDAGISRDVVKCIYDPRASSRESSASGSDFFTDEELEHPHLTTDHSDRAIAIDYIDLVIGKVKEHLGGDL